MNKGLVYIFTGEGKGKTSAAIGTVVRAVGAGMKVAWVGFYKQESWKLSEIEPLKKLGINVFLMGRGFNIQGTGYRVQGTGIKTAPVSGGVVVDTATEQEHEGAAREALSKAGELIKDVDVLVLDEVNNAVADKLIDLIDLIDLISKRNKTHMILTGRNADKKVIELADVVTEMKKVKHMFDEGKLAIRGLDF